MARARVSQHGVEVWYDYTAASPTTITGVGITQHGVEVFLAPDTRAVVSQHGVEVFYIASADDSETGGGGGSPAPVTRAYGYAV